MTVSVGDGLSFLVPEGDLKEDDWLSSDLVSGTYVMCGHKYFGYPATVISNKHRNGVMNGISVDDVDGFRIIVSFSPKHDLMIIWEEGLIGRQHGVQVWKEGGTFRNVWESYRARHKTMDGINALKNWLYPEVYGDRFQVLNVMDYHYRAMNLQLNLIFLLISWITYP